MIMTNPEKPFSSSMPSADSGKLFSLLALATGAAVMPQSGQADIIVKSPDGGPVHVGFASGDITTFLFDNLPGGANRGGGFNAQEGTAFNTTTFGTISFKSVIFGQRSGTVPFGGQVGGSGFAVPQPFGAARNNLLNSVATVRVGSATTSDHNPANGYDHQYLAFQFSDTTRAGAIDYGWVEIGLALDNLASSSFGPDVTIYQWAYDNTGAPISMGAGVPEPAPMSIVALAAMALGAKGMRSWRRRSQPAASK
jgi:hypothetical protein